MNESDKIDADMLIAAYDPQLEHTWVCQSRQVGPMAGDHNGCGCWCHG